MNTYLESRKNIKFIKSFVSGLLELEDVLEELGNFEKIKNVLVADIADLESAKSSLQKERDKALEGAVLAVKKASAEADQMRSEAQSVLDKANQRAGEVATLLRKAEADAADIITSAQKKAELEVKGVGNELARVRSDLEKLTEQRDSILREIELSQKTLEKAKADLRALKDKIAA